MSKLNKVQKKFLKAVDSNSKRKALKKEFKKHNALKSLYTLI
jgi:hypothetical protein